MATLTMAAMFATLTPPMLPDLTLGVGLLGDKNLIAETENPAITRNVGVIQEEEK